MAKSIPQPKRGAGQQDALVKPSIKDPGGGYSHGGGFNPASGQPVGGEEGKHPK